MIDPATVLVVEDDHSLRVVIRMVLEQAGYDVLEARHGGAALELMDGGRPDLVVADLRMPVMDGAELMGRLRSKPATASIPIVLLTGLVPDPTVSSLADAVVIKPFEPADLVAAIRGSLAVTGPE
jgi:two-component system, chemotaxis family, chemotaxis protein CheY